MKARRLGILIALLILAAIASLVWQGGPEGVRQFCREVSALGAGGVLLWGMAMWVLVPLAVPVSLCVTLSGLTFGPWWGFGAAWLGLSGAGAVAFILSRVLGRATIEHLLGERLGPLEAAIHRHGAFGVLYMRLLPLPLALISYLAGLTRIRFLPYWLATTVGVAPVCLANAVLAGVLGEVWQNEQDWRAFFRPDTAWAGALMGASLMAPLVIEKIRRHRASRAKLIP